MISSINSCLQREACPVLVTGVRCCSVRRQQEREDAVAQCRRFHRLCCCRCVLVLDTAYCGNGCRTHHHEYGFGSCVHCDGVYVYAMIMS